MSRRTATRPEVWVGGFKLSGIAPRGWGELRHSTRVNGAWEASWSIPFAGNWRHPALVYGALVEIRFGPLVIWSGSLTEPDWDAGLFVATGASRDGEDAVAMTGAEVASTAPNTVIDAAIARGVVSWKRDGDFGTTPVGNVNDLGGLASLSSVLDAWAQVNGSGWFVTPDRRLIIKPVSESEPKWFVTPGSGVLGSADEDRADRVFVVYVNSTTGGYSKASYPATTPVSGVERPVDLTDRGPMTPAVALTTAESIWNERLAGRSGWTNGLTLKRGQVTTRGGIEADLALIQAGDSIRLQGVPDPRGLEQHLDVVIGDTDYEWTDDENQVNPVGLAARDRDSVLEQVKTLAVEAKARAGGATYEGPWIPYTPAWTGATTNPVIGNGVISGRYIQVGKTVDFRVVIAMGSSTTYGSGQYRVGLPVAALGTQLVDADGLFGGDTAVMRGRVIGSTAFLYCSPTAAGAFDRVVTGAIPATWTTGSVLTVSGTYEAA